MAAGSISLLNIENTIELFNKDLSQCNLIFSKIEDDFMQLKDDNQVTKSEIKLALSDTHRDLLRNIAKINNFILEENFQIGNNITQFDMYEKVLQSFIKSFNESFIQSKLYKEKFLENYKDLKKAKDSSNSTKSEIRLNELNERALHCKQTDNPFIIMKLQSERKQCSGCQGLIPPQSFYLSHIEQNPADEYFVPHVYHITQECLIQRRFEMKYLNKTKVISNLAVDNDFNKILTDIGFQEKNIFLTDSQLCDNDDDSDDEINKDRNSDNDYKDNISEASDVSSVPSIMAPNIPASEFIYHRKAVSDTNVITCQGCQTNIETETYISLHANSSSIPFHIQRNCLKIGGALPDDFSRTKCLVYKLLNTHNDLKELLACGFSFTKIVGHRHFKPIDSKRRTKNARIQLEDVQHKNTNEKAYLFILNEEPFHYERLTYGEKCKGCFSNIVKNEMTLRHQERVPREKLDSSPLISQYYHASKECLLKRGFTIAYLSNIQCKAILSQADSSFRVTEALIQYGFSNKNILCISKESKEPRISEIAPTNIRDNDKGKCSKFVNDFPDNLSEASKSAPNTPIYEFLYHRKAVTDRNVIICQGCQTNIETETYISFHANSSSIPFHIKKICLKIGEVFPDDLSRMKCMVYKLLNTHNDLKELLACGFYFNKIVGFKPQNPINQKPHTANAQRQVDRVQHNSSDLKTSLFLFNNEPFHYEILMKSQKCKGCNNQMLTNSMILRHQERVPRENLDSSPLISQYYHASKECLLKRGFTIAYLSNIQCKAILSQADSSFRVTEALIQYGFSNKNIICISKESKEPRISEIAPKPLVKNTGKQKGHDMPNELTLFIFNEEPFLYEKLSHAENCMGCKCQIRKNEMVLRHRECVTKEKISSCPLISQHYHVSKECLLKRGFMPKYLSFIQCKATLSGDDNLSRVTKILINCGFSIKNIVYIPKEINEASDFGNYTKPTKRTSEYKFYIVYCTKPSALCSGCGFIMMPNQPCLIYSLTPEQNSSEKYFHIKKTCLQNHFTKEQIMATSCITNNLVDVSPIDIINCGIVKIVTEPSIPSTENICKPPEERRYGTEIAPKLKIKPTPPPVRYKPGVGNHSMLCCACGKDIPRGLYSLKIPKRPLNQALVHLDPVCVAKLGLKPQDEENCELVFCERFTTDGVPELTPTASGDAQSSGFLI